MVLCGAGRSPGGRSRMGRGDLAWGVVGLLVVLPWLLAAGAAAPTAVGSAPFFLTHGARSGSSSSTNWAGYAVTGAKGSVTSVNGSWIEPTATCTSGKTGYAAFWVGIDGYNSRTVEQTGTDSDCRGSTPAYYAWFEFYPNPSHTISRLKISPGDTISAQVLFLGKAKFKVTLSDVTTGKSYSTTASVRNAARTSAEWIAEAPSSVSGVLPLSNFGTVGFGYDSTSVAGTNTATVGGTTSDLGAFSTAVAITMVSASSASTVKALPSAISTDQTSFSVTWKSAGP